MWCYRSILVSAMICLFDVVVPAQAEHKKEEHTDRLWQMSTTSLRNGEGPDDILHSDITNFMENTIFKNEASLLYLDSLWSFDSGKAWKENIIQEIHGNITAGGLPMYVYNYYGWNPDHPFFMEWWQRHVNDLEDFPEFQFTKYRAIMLVLKGDSIVQGMINAISGEGGGFCIYKLTMNALGKKFDREDMTEKEKQYYDHVCVEQAQHPERSKFVFMHGSPCGWLQYSDSKDTKPSICDDNYGLVDEL